MSKLEYSTSALNVLNKFHRTKAVMFVEGHDDIHFWKSITEKAGVESLHIEEVGGTKNLEDKIDKIIHENAKFIVAKDSDQGAILSKTHKNPKIITTYGHSIENSMYCPKTINRFAGFLARSLNNLVETIDNWYADFSADIERLIVYDLASYMYGKGVGVFGDSCVKFLKSNNSPYTSKEKILKFTEAISGKFTEEEINKCNEIINKQKIDIRWFIKGHFLSNAVINLVKSIVKKIRGSKVSISLESLYAFTVNGCSVCKSNNCKSFVYMKDNIINAVATI